MSEVMISARGISKKFVMHQQNGAVINVFDQLNFDAYAGSCWIIGKRLLEKIHIFALHQVV